MKVPKLFTSQGFGFWLKSMTTKEFCELSGAKVPTPTEGANGFYRIDAIKLRLRDDWDKKLTGSLKKEMFVNELDVVLRSDYGVDAPEFNTYKYPSECYAEDLGAFQEAEKKVIIESPQVVSYDMLFTIDTEGTTLHDLAEATKGELKLKNINL